MAHRGPQEGRLPGGAWAGRHRCVRGVELEGPQPQGRQGDAADWDEVALNGREVTIVYDGDTQRKRQVRQAMSALASWLNKKGAKVSCAWLPDTDHKTGVDDYLQDHTVEDLRQLVRPFDEKLDGDPGERKASAATQLIDMALEEYTLGITDDEEPFARGKHSHVALMLRGGKASCAPSWLAATSTPTTPPHRSRRWPTPWPRWRATRTSAAPSA